MIPEEDRPIGLFSKTKIFVDSFTMPLVEDTPNYMQQSILTSIKGERPIVDDIIANNINSLGVKFGAYYRYGRDYYYYGLPQGGTVQPALSYIIKDTIESTLPEGTKIYLDYSVFDLANPTYFAEDFLINTRGWDRNTNIIHNPPPGSQGEVRFVSAEFYSPTQIYITYTHDVDEANPIFDIITTDANQGAEYYHCSYFIYDVAGELGSTRYWWFYDITTNLYPGLEPIRGDKSPYFPVVPLRHDNVDFTVDDGSERYRTSKRLLQKAQLNIQELGKGVNENPDINEIDHAYVIMGIPLSAKNSGSLNYLFNYWKNLQPNARYAKRDFEAWTRLTDIEKATQTPPMNIISIKEAGISYDVELGYLYMETQLVTGSIGKKGHVTAQFILRDASEYSGYAFENSEYILRKQLTEDTYEQINIYGLKHVSHIYDGHTVDTTLADVVASMNDPNNDSDNFVVPIHNEVFQLMSNKDRTEMGYEGMRIGFHTIVKQKLKWYQTGFFQFVAIVVAVVITVVSFGSMSQSIVWAAGLVGSTSAIVGAVVLASLLIGIRYGVNYLVDVLGEEFGLFLAVAMTVIGLSGSGIISAEAMSVLQSGIQSGIQMSMDTAMEDIRNGYDELQREIEVAEKELEELAEELNTTWLVNPFGIPNSTSGLALPNETPEQYYNTRIHLGNMAPFTYTQIENYVDTGLYLEGITLHRGIKA